ncbi:hypothetical protein Pmani_030245 [Petrolisthes manimaculis]|uniref:Uncharacterized protein n=1 Tax=Petrolisthes manimaculis TaxID=1843537 RepID=A0AAE1NVY1_9EUCA|nr:hypothetical protein Pmani_030245 [Petrolisthes manimaculis]
MKATTKAVVSCPGIVYKWTVKLSTKEPRTDQIFSTQDEEGMTHRAREPDTHSSPLVCPHHYEGTLDFTPSHPHFLFYTSCAQAL